MVLKDLPNETLLHETKNLVARERELVLEILNHLKEIDSRRLHLEIGHPSLWAFCTKELGYSEAAAQRRIEAMRALWETPVLAEKIEFGSLSLSNVAKVQSVVRKANQSAETKFTPSQKLDLFKALENKSQKEADQILAKHFPESITNNEKIRPVTENLSEIKFLATGELLVKLEKVKSLLLHSKPNPTMAELLGLMAHLVIKKKDPLSQKAKAIDANPPPQRRFTRHIPVSVKRAVWKHSQGTCEYFDPHSNRRCGSRHQLELEHVRPKVFGGTNDPENLKLYCRAHNVHAAQQATLM